MRRHFCLHGAALRGAAQRARRNEVPGARVMTLEIFRERRHVVIRTLCARGFAVLLGGFGYGADPLHVPQTWIIVGALIIVGIGVIMSAVTRTKMRDPSNEAPPPPAS